jgi:hypothetical protein
MSESLAKEEHARQELEEAAQTWKEKILGDYDYG